MPDIWVAVGASGLLGGLIAALLGAAVSVWQTSRSIHQKSVIDQRQRWRDSLRELVPEFLSERDKALRLRLRDKIVLHLNPYKDRTSVMLIDRFVADRSPSNRKAVVDHFQVMLKQEWEKSKIEARLNSRNAETKAGRTMATQQGEFGPKR